MGCELWYVWGREWQVVMISFECTFSIMVFMKLFDFDTLCGSHVARPMLCTMPQLQAPCHALNINILMLINLKIIGSERCG